MFGALGFYSAKGMTVVPGVTGQTQATAQTNLETANLTYTTTTLNTNAEIQNGLVGSQSIEPGTLVDYGTNVVIGIFVYTALTQVTPPTLSQSRNSSTTATVTVVNYDPDNTYSISTSGTATFSAGVFSITGLTSDNSFTATVTASRSGFSSAQTSISVSNWSGGTSNGGNLTVLSTSTSSVTLRASMWNTSTSSITWYAQRSGTTIASGSIGPFTSQSSPQTSDFTASGLAEGTTYTFNLFVLGNLVSTTSATTGTTPPPTQTWYCRQWNASGGIIANYTSSTNQSGSTDCETMPTLCSLSGYPTQPVYC